MCLVTENSRAVSTRGTLSHGQRSLLSKRPGGKAATLTVSVPLSAIPSPGQDAEDTADR